MSQVSYAQSYINAPFNFFAEDDVHTLMTSSSYYSNNSRTGISYDIYGSNLVYNQKGFIVSGTVTDISVWQNHSVPLLSVSGAKVDVATYNAVVGNLPGASAANAALQYLMSGDDVISVGGSSAGVFKGFAGNDTFYETSNGKNTIYGGDGVDTLYVNHDSYAGLSSDFTIVKNSGGSTTITCKKNPVNDVSGVNGITHTVYDVEKLVFEDAYGGKEVIRLDVSGNAGQAYRLYQAAFNRSPDKDGLNYWIGILDSGVNLKDVANAFELSAEFSTLYGNNPTAGQLITAMYSNVLHRAPDQGGYDYWLHQMDAGAVGKETLLMNFSESAENQAALIGIIGNGIHL